MSTKRVLAITLILGWIGGMIAGCGGADSSTDPAGGSSGSDAGVSGNQGTRTVPAVKGPNGEWVCTQGLLLKSEPPECMIEGSTLADSGELPDETADANEEMDDSMLPDAGPACPDLDGRLCPNRNNCTILAVEGTTCSFHCMNSDGSENFGATDGPESSQWLIGFCGLTRE